MYLTDPSIKVPSPQKPCEADQNKQDGGTKGISMDIQLGYDDILKQGKALFFPEGTSRKDQESDFDFNVWDFKQNTLPKDVLIENI